MLFSNVDIKLKKGDKVAIISKNSLAISEFFEIISGNATADKGEYNWGVTTNQSYMPLDNTDFFQDKSLNLVDWLRQFTKMMKKDTKNSCVVSLAECYSQETKH